MAFDVEEFRVAHRPWQFTVGARTYGARHISAPQMFQYQEDIVAAAGNRRRQERLLRRLLRRAFPWRPSYLLRGDPVRTVLQLEPAARQAALHDFFAALRGGPAMTTEGRAIPGMR
jgi:hypothetical protein